MAKPFHEVLDFGRCCFTMTSLTLISRSSADSFVWRLLALARYNAPRPNLFSAPVAFHWAPSLSPAFQAISQPGDRLWLLPAAKISHLSQPTDKQVLGKVTQTLFPQKFGPFFVPLFDPLLLSYIFPNYAVPLLFTMNWPPWQGRLDLCCPNRFYRVRSP